MSDLGFRISIKKKFIIKLVFIHVIVVFFLSCQEHEKNLILVSKDPTKSYTTWLVSLDSSLEIREFYSISKDSLKFFLSEADGIVMTGGEDVNPDLYGMPGYRDLCEKPDNYRDSIETLMIRYAVKNDVPMLGICRGQQIINAVNGGTLIPDIPTEKPESPIRHRSKSDSAHLITPLPNSWISDHYGFKSHWVNSRHHQCVDKLAPGFRSAAFSPDGVIESIELEENHKHPFIIGVQWHPENLRDSLSTTLGQIFLSNL